MIGPGARKAEDTSIANVLGNGETSCTMGKEFYNALPRTTLGTGLAGKKGVRIFALPKELYNKTPSHTQHPWAPRRLTRHARRTARGQVTWSIEIEPYSTHVYVDRPL